MLRRILSPDLNSKNRIYKRHLNWTKQFVKDNIDLIEKNYFLYPNRNKWKCNVHSMHDYESDNFYRINYEFLRKEYEKVAADVTKKYGIEKYGLSDIWYNYYKKDQFQEPHTHLGPKNHRKPGGFAAVHYLIFDPKYHFATQFTDPNIKPLRVGCGDIVFFPDDVYHYVPPSETDRPRLTAAFTIRSDD
tara:strand:- start:897 stop:1463 length:567 start_codon:yes stop_codon:yes gene_type:complete